MIPTTAPPPTAPTTTVNAPRDRKIRQQFPCAQRIRLPLLPPPIRLGSRVTSSPPTAPRLDTPRLRYECAVDAGLRLTMMTVTVRR